MVALLVEGVIVHVVVESLVAEVLIAGEGGGLVTDDRAVEDFVETDGEVGVDVAEKSDAYAGDQQVPNG